MDHVITELNNYTEDRVKEREERPTARLFDAKIAFKGQASIRQMEQQTLSVTRALSRRIDDFLFSVESVR
jgi:hypothetical protein